ncbi:hypothetical protein BGW42_007081 [Actinomortierella wolfii]|nr:hypothetical protein BGW42_007081 [Actinomortierella wolfii]
MTDAKSHNEEFYNSAATKYDANQYSEELCTKASKAVLDAYIAVNPSHQEARVLEFGIGTGLVAVKIAPFIDSMLGIDISEEMLNQVHKKLSDPKYAAIAPKIQTVQHSVTMDTPLPPSYPNRDRDVISSDGQQDQGFDLVYSTQVIHHVDNPPEMIHTLVKNFVKRGTGWFFLVDNEHEDGTQEYFHKVAHEVFRFENNDHGHDHGHAHGHGNNAHKEFKFTDVVPHDTGFRHEDLHRWLTEAGLVDIQIKHTHTVEFYLPSEDKNVPFKFLIAGGRRA